MSSIINGVNYIGVKDGSSISEYVHKIINIGDWDMTTTGTITVPHGLSSTEYKTIKNIDISIRDDDNTIISHAFMNGFDGRFNPTDSTNFNLFRNTGGYYQVIGLYTTTPYNRGYISFMYKPD